MLPVLLSFQKLVHQNFIVLRLLLSPLLFINDAGMADIFVFNQPTRNDILHLLNLAIHTHDRTLFIRTI